jgi:hypothetical protein
MQTPDSASTASSSQLVSRRRVADFGEVYTGEREVNAMLDLVKQETERIESRFLEPACGTGNFLVEVLRRKLDVVESRYKKDVNEYELYSFIAVSSLYGIDILQDNVLRCRERLFNFLSSRYVDLFGPFSTDAGIADNYPKAIEFILGKNIIWGDALSLQAVDDGDGKPPKPIIFSEWAAVGNGMVKRRDFSFKNLLDYVKDESETLFSDTGDEVLMPKPVKEYPLTHFLRLNHAD